VKSLGISQVQFVTSLLPDPTGFVKEVNQILYKFVWKHGTDKIKRNILMQDYKNGGSECQTWKQKLKVTGSCG
jgi:hypothetical protein